MAYSVTPTWVGVHAALSVLLAAGCLGPALSREGTIVEPLQVPSTVVAGTVLLQVTITASSTLESQSWALCPSFLPAHVTVLIPCKAKATLQGLCPQPPHPPHFTHKPPPFPGPPRVVLVHGHRPGMWGRGLCVPTTANARLNGGLHLIKPCPVWRTECSQGWPAVLLLL